MIGRPAAWVVAGVAAMALAAGCGRKGDPRPPLRPAPAPLSDVSVQRADDRIQLRFRVPAANADNSTPSVLERVEIYVVAAPAAAPAPTPAQVAVAGNLKARIDIRRTEATVASAAPAPAGAAPVLPAPAAPADPRPAPGDVTSYSDTITADRLGPSGPTLHYVLVEVAGRRRLASPVMSVPLSAVVPAPADLAASYDERTLRLTWNPGAAGQTFRVYDVNASGRPIEGSAPPGAPLAEAAMTAPVEFGKLHCFAVRGLKITGVVALESALSSPVCVTPVDSFPPPAPADLRAFPGVGSIALTWSSVDVPDLAGYIVLRGEGTGDRLQPLFAEPITATLYTDRQVTPGTAYWYIVRAVDKSERRNVSADSNRQQAIAR